jgi:hypothetical protein
MGSRVEAFMFEDETSSRKLKRTCGTLKLRRVCRSPNMYDADREVVRIGSKYTLPGW